MQEMTDISVILSSLAFELQNGEYMNNVFHLTTYMEEKEWRKAYMKGRERQGRQGNQLPCLPYQNNP